MGCAGDGGDVVHTNVCAGGVFTDMIAGTNAAAVNQYVDTSYSSEPAATELDEIFRSIGTTGCDHSDMSQSSCTDMEGLNWNHHIQQGQSVVQNHLGVPYTYWLQFLFQIQLEVPEENRTPPQGASPG
ncbi:hypothetical protein EJB05_00081, partial [Eragrostis curvula]